MLRKFKVELELCGPAHSTLEDVAEFIEALKSNKDVSENADIFAFGDYDVFDEGKMTLDDWNGDEVGAVAVEE